MHIRSAKLMVIWLAALCVLITPVMAVEYFVAPAPAGSDGNGGTGWGDAFLTISNALAQGDTTIVTVSNGTYTVTATVSNTTAVTIRSFGGGIYGGLANASNTVVQRTGGTGGALFRVFQITDSGVILDGLTITGGMGRNVNGLGINMTGGIIRNCIVTDNGDLSNASACGHSSGAIYMTGGMVSNSTIRANKTCEDQAPGIYASGSSKIIDCRILDNKQTANYSCSGGGVYAAASSVLIRNCLITGNVVKDNGAGVYGGTVESCTVVSNRSRDAVSQGGGVYNSTVKNSIILNNSTASGVPADANYAGSASLTYSCAAPLPSGAGNVEYTEFVDAASSNYQLRAGAAVDSGTNAAWMAAAVDLAGGPRLAGVGDVVDMGAYEKQPGALECAFSADSASTVVGSNVVFTALPSGTNINIISSSWTFGDGQVASGLVVTNVYASPGAFTVSLSLANDASENASASYTNYMTIWGETAYVATNSPSPSEPYHTWSNAALLVQAAVDAVPVGTTIVLSNGTYEIADTITLDREMTICSYGDGRYGGLENAADTVVRRPGSNPAHRVIRITDPNVVLNGLTVSGGKGRGVPGMGINMTGGTVLNCIISNNGSTSTSDGGLADGGGIWMNGGMVSNCIIQANVIPEGHGVGIRAQGNARILNCRILDNTKVAPQYSKSGGGIYASSSSVLIRNCLVARNISNASGGGIYGGTVVNCSVISNNLTAVGGEGAGVYLAGGSSVSNSIIYFNEAAGVHTNLNTTTGIGYCCFTIPDDLSNGNISDDPLFADLAGDDFRTTDLSPCMDKGDSSIVDWETDLDGNPRIKGVVDMGCYEFQPAAGCVIIIR